MIARAASSRSPARSDYEREPSASLQALHSQRRRCTGTHAEAEGPPLWTFPAFTLRLNLIPPMLGAMGSPTRVHALHLPYHPCLMHLELTQKERLAHGLTKKRDVCKHPYPFANSELQRFYLNMMQ